jgi:hypothetical protein
MIYTYIYIFIYIALFSTKSESLKNHLDEIYRYSDKWGLRINLNKTKVRIFQKRQQQTYYNFDINGKVIINSRQFRLSRKITFTHIGNMINAVKALSEQTLRAYKNLLSLFSRVTLDVKTKTSLLDSMIAPIILILFVSEVWENIIIKK